MQQYQKRMNVMTIEISNFVNFYTLINPFRRFVRYIYVCTKLYENIVKYHLKGLKRKRRVEEFCMLRINLTKVVIHSN